MSTDTAHATQRNPAFEWGMERWHYWLLLVGLLLRLAYCTQVGHDASFGGWDGQEYHAYAQNLLHFRGDDYPRFFNTIRAPGYPLFLVPFVALSSHFVWHIQVAQCFLGLLQVWLLAKIAARWAGRRAGHLAFVIATFHPFLIYYCAFVLTENVFITLLWLGIYCLQRMVRRVSRSPLSWLVAAGLSFGLACLTRPALQPFLVVAVFWVGFIAWRERNLKVVFVRMTLFTVAASVVMLPWMIRNYALHGEPTLSPRGAQLVYAQSNSPEYLQTYEAKNIDDYYRALTAMHLRFAATNGVSTAQWLKDANEFKYQHHDDWLRLQRYKFIHFWTPWLNPMIFPRFQFLVSIIVLTPMFLLAAIETVRRLRRLDAMLCLMLGLVVVGYIVGGLLFHVQVRYRVPFVDVTFVILASSWLAYMTSRRNEASQQPAKVLWISCVGEKGGAEVYMLNLLRHLDRSRFTPAVVLLRPGPLAQELREAQVEVFELPMHRMRNIASVLRAVWSIHGIIRKHGFDLVTTNGFRGHVYGGLAAGLADVPETWVVHTAEKPGFSTSAIFAIPTDYVIANSPRTADDFVAHGCATSLIWPSVDVERVRQGTSREELVQRYQVPASGRWVCMGARLQRYKGHEYLLRALAALPGTAGNTHAIIIGGALFGMESNYPAELKQLAATLGIQNRVHFTGFISDADVYGFVAASELLVHPALDEDFGIIIAEAQALGKPVIAFDVTGPRAIVISQQTGLLVPVGNQTALNGAFFELLHHPERMNLLGAAGAERSSRLFGAAAAAHQIERIYTTCLLEAYEGKLQSASAT